MNFLKLPSKNGLHYNAVIEIPKGCKVKQELSETSPDKLVIDRKVNPRFCYAYGLIPNTLAKDGDCIDVFVIGKNKILKELAVVVVEPVSMLGCVDNGEEDNKIICKVVGTKLGRWRLRHIEEVVKDRTESKKGVECAKKFNRDTQAICNFIETQRLDKPKVSVNQRTKVDDAYAGLL